MRSFPRTNGSEPRKPDTELHHAWDAHAPLGAHTSFSLVTRMPATPLLSQAQGGICLPLVQTELQSTHSVLGSGHFLMEFRAIVLSSA